MPKSGDDEVPPLLGDKDLAYAIPPQNLRYHVQGSDQDWLPISSMPHELRAGGFVYLQDDAKWIARCRVRGIGFRERRWTHEHPSSTADAGPGATLELFGDEWELVSIHLGPAGEAEVRGYRYLVTLPNGSVRLPEVEAS
ncbi:MAG: hypothetical protein O3C27_14865 [Actinomycetota bacterium]|nr:hypothetical protein [Actinomycetota bacterium]